MFFEQRQRRVDRAGAGGVLPAEAVFDGLDQFIAVPRCFGDQPQDDQAQVALAEDAAAATAAAATAGMAAGEARARAFVEEAGGQPGVAAVGKAMATLAVALVVAMAEGVRAVVVMAMPKAAAGEATAVPGGMPEWIVEHLHPSKSDRMQ
ncbi:MAG: hypothetical protein ABT05_05865 [Lautropia sp. SCN 66-9]|nr:MAG: hypothetical protein ABT05_05865 [Lautropia sp. SCN 66-9]